MERVPSQEEIYWLRYYIDLCMELAMNKTQTADFLATQFHIPLNLTQAVWEMLEQENPEAFGYYNEMAELHQQNVTNYLYQLRQHNGDSSSDQQPPLHLPRTPL